MSEMLKHQNANFYYTRLREWNFQNHSILKRYEQTRRHAEVIRSDLRDTRVRYLDLDIFVFVEHEISWDRVLAEPSHH